MNFPTNHSLDTPILLFHSPNKLDIKNIISLSDSLLYQVSDKVFNYNYFKNENQRGILLEDNVLTLNSLTESYALLLTRNGMVKVFSNELSYCHDLCSINIIGTQNTETDPINQILINFDLNKRFFFFFFSFINKPALYNQHCILK
jgi:hypothetical protein